MLALGLSSRTDGPTINPGALNPDEEYAIETAIFGIHRGVTNDRIETHIVIILEAIELRSAIFGLEYRKALSHKRLALRRDQATPLGVSLNQTVG